MTSVDRLDGIRDGLGIKAPVRLATTANITLSGLQTIDAVATAEGDRILVKNQSINSQNGIYNASSGNWTRALDFNGNRDVVSGTHVYVGFGVTNSNTLFAVYATDSPVVIGTSSIAFVLSGEGGLVYELRPEMYGVTPYRGLDPDSSPDCTPGLTAMFAAADTLKVPVRLPWGIYRLASALPRPICNHYLQLHWEAGAQLYADYNEADNTRGVLAFITYAAVMTGFMNISKRNGTTGGVALSFVVTTDTVNIGAMIIDSGWLTAANFYTPPGWTNPTSLYLDGTANDSAAVGFRDFFADQLLVFGNAILKGVRLPQIANGIVGGTLDLRGIPNTPGDLTGAYPYTDGVQFSGLVGGDVYFGETRRSVVRADIGGNVYNTKYNAGTGEWGSLFCKVDGRVAGITETNWMTQRYELVVGPPAKRNWLGPPVDEFGNKSYSHSTAQMGYIVARDSDASGYSGWELYSNGQLKKWGSAATDGVTGLVNVNVNTYEYISNGQTDPGRGPAFAGYRLALKTSNKNAGAGNAPDNQIYDLDANWSATPFVFTAKGKILIEPVLGSLVINLASIAFLWETNGDAA